jgi:beta-galactosidase
MRANDSSVVIPWLQRGHKISILVENEARPGYGSKLNESKGLVQNVTLHPWGAVAAGENNNDGVFVLTNWSMYPIPLNRTSGLSALPAYVPGVDKRAQFPAFFRASFTVPESVDLGFSDTFLKFDNWGKGVLFVNGVNLGRYWAGLGPQKTLFVPGPVLRPHPEQNEVLLFELEHVSPGCHRFCYVESVAEHDIVGR